MMEFSIISGTNRPGNLSIQVARHYQKLLQAKDYSAEIHNLENLPREFGSADLYGGLQPHFEPFQAMVDSSRNFIFIVPEYNGSLPGILKLFIDACAYPRSFAGKRAALVGISAGELGNRAGLGHMEDILTFLGTEVMPEKVYAGKLRQKIDTEGSIIDQNFKQALESQVAALANFLA